MLRNTLGSLLSVQITQVSSFSSVLIADSTVETCSCQVRLPAHTMNNTIDLHVV